MNFEKEEKKCCCLFDHYLHDNISLFLLFVLDLFLPLLLFKAVLLACINFPVQPPLFAAAFNNF